MKNNNTLTRRTILKTATTLPLLTLGAAGVSHSMTNDTITDFKYDFDTPFNRTGVNSIKWDSAIAQYGAEKIKVPMTIADMDFKQMPEIKEAFLERIQYEGYGYETPPSSYFDAIIKWNKDRYGLEIKKEWIKNSTGLVAAMAPAMRALNPAGGKVVVMTPTYNGFFKEIKNVGMTMVTSPMKKVGSRWQMDLDDLEERFDDKTKILILCNPNNPTGEAWTVDELRALGDVCIRHGVTVLSDEIWAGCVRKEKTYTPYASIGEKYANTSITYQSAAKLFNQPALKVSYFFSQNTTLLDKVMNEGGHHDEVNIFGIIGTEVAFTHGHRWMSEMNSYLDESYEFLDGYINKHDNLPGIKFDKPDSLYLAWLDCSVLIAKLINAGELAQSGNIEHALSEWLIEKAGVQINPGVTYGIGGEGYMRMNIALPHSQLEEALDRIRNAIATI